MVAKPEGYIGAKLIPDAVALNAVLEWQLGKADHPLDTLAAAGYPKKVVVAKLHKFEKRGWTAGHKLTLAGQDALREADGEVVDYIKRRGDNV